MKNLGKYLILCLSVAIMLAHSFIPHDHHYGEEIEHQVYEDKCGHDETIDVGEVLFCIHHETENETECEECHFTIETIDHTKKIIQLYISDYKKSLNNPLLVAQKYIIYYSQHYITTSIKLPILRAPPQRS